MGWVYLDDHFPEHPKAQQAGDDACWLYVCGLAYVHRNGTDGVIPKSVIRRLVSKTNTAALARRLVDARLWHDDGDQYRINDYEVWNAKAMARRAQARGAAKTRWSRAPAMPKQDALSNASALPAQQTDSIATALPYEPRNQGTKEPAAAAGPPGTHDPPPERPAEAAATALPPTVTVGDQAVQILAQRHLDAASGPIANPGGWLRSAAAGIRADHRDALAALDPSHWQDDPEGLADHLEPPRAPIARRDPHDATQAAQQAIGDRKPCPVCGSRNGMTDTEVDGQVVAGRCADIHPPASVQ